MKMWQRILSTVLIILCITVPASPFSSEECCLCNALRHHAPCLIDLKTGELLELELYFPHETAVAELANPQPVPDTFSFIRFGSINGTKSSDHIALTVPISEKITTPLLCEHCRRQSGTLLMNRYAFADLYETGNKRLIPIHPKLAVQLRCYQISAQKSQEGFLTVSVLGLLDTKRHAE